MIVLDTNVISELMKDEPERKVMRWVDSLEWLKVFTTAITRAELLYGAAILPAGKRRTDLERQFVKMFESELRDRVLSFDCRSADPFAEIRARRRRAGREIKSPDAMIAAICAQYGYAIGTREVGGFSGCGIEVIDPWR